MERLIVSEFADAYQDWPGDEGSAKHAVWLDLPIGDLGPNRVLSVSPDVSVRDAVRVMSDVGCGAVLVADGGELLGIFTERDLSVRVVCEGLSAEHTRVGAVMTPRPEAIDAGDTLGQALRTLLLGGYRHLPVVDAAGRAVNVVSVRRIMEHVAELFPDQVFNAALSSRPPPRPSRDGG